LAGSRRRSIRIGMTRLASILAPAFALVAAALLLTSPSALAQALSPVSIQSGDKTHEFKVEIADTEEERVKGLMFRESLPKDGGMLFDFGAPQQATIWMKNTLIPLDILFIDEDGDVVAIARNAVPQSLRLITPGVPVKGVLEINGGAAAEFGINPGDKVVHPMFKPAAAHGG